MSGFTCPHCKREVDTGDIPDHLTDMINNQFEFECECGCTFDVNVDWHPYCTVRRASIKLPDRTALQAQEGKP